MTLFSNSHIANQFLVSDKVRAQGCNMRQGVEYCRTGVVSF